MKSKYEIYEIVKVISNSPHRKRIYGWTGFISGKSEEDDGTFAGAYSVFFCDNRNHFLFEDEIESTGKFEDPDNHKPVEIIRVEVLPDSSGKIVNENGTEQSGNSKVKSSVTKEKLKKQLMKYSKLQFGEELRERLLKKESIDEIAMWAYSVYLEHERYEDEFHSLLSILASMDQGPNFMLSYEKLKEIADDLCNGKEVNFDDLPS